MLAILSKPLLAIDKFLDLFGERKAQKGFAVAALSTIILKFFPDFPQEAATNLIESATEVVSLIGQIYISLGILHQWIKDQLLKRGYIPPSIVARAEVDTKQLIKIVPVPKEN